MLSEVVGARELLATVGALEWLLTSVKRTVVALEVFLTAELAAAKIASEGLGRIISQRLLATTATDGVISWSSGGGWCGGVFRARDHGTFGCAILGLVVGSGSLLV
jgi:hypothetical protein